MKKVNKKKGFTLAELLVVIAILAVLIAIAVPIFSSSLDSAKQAVKDANYRAAKSAAMVNYLDNKLSGSQYYDYTVDDQGTITLTGPKTSGTDGATGEKAGTVLVSQTTVNAAS